MTAFDWANRNSSKHICWLFFIIASAIPHNNPLSSGCQWVCKLSAFQLHLPEDGHKFPWEWAWERRCSVWTASGDPFSRIASYLLVVQVYDPVRCGLRMAQLPTTQLKLGSFFFFFSSNERHGFSLHASQRNANKNLELETSRLLRTEIVGVLAYICGNASNLPQRSSREAELGENVKRYERKSITISYPFWDARVPWGEHTEEVMASRWRRLA